MAAVGEKHTFDEVDDHLEEGVVEKAPAKKRAPYKKKAKVVHVEPTAGEKLVISPIDTSNMSAEVLRVHYTNLLEYAKKILNSVPAAPGEPSPEEIKR